VIQVFFLNPFNLTLSDGEHGKYDLQANTKTHPATLNAGVMITVCVTSVIVVLIEEV